MRTDSKGRKWWGRLRSTMALRMDVALMTIMFAGGMTIAIPGETPVAVAQTGMLSVSATAAPNNAFGGPQVIEIVVDDPSKSELNEETGRLDVTIDGEDVTMAQATTGKWYAYVASQEILNGEQGGEDFDGTFVDDTPIAFGAVDLGTPVSGTNVLKSSALLTTSVRIASVDTATAERNIGDTYFETATSPSGNKPVIQVFKFADESDIDVVYDDETVTLRYEQDLDDLASVDVDRRGAPIGGQVHVTVSDFQLNLNPNEEDVWIMKADGTLTSLVIGTDTNADNWLDTDTTDEIITPFFAGDTGVLDITDVGAVVKLAYDNNDDDTDTNLADGAIILTETGSNTGVFESQQDDVSAITVIGVENDDFTIDYAGNDVQVFVEDFDSTLEMIADGTWVSGAPLTVRLSSENLDLNTLDENNMKITDENIPTIVLGDGPTTVEDLGLTPVRSEDGLSVDETTLVVTLTATTASTVFEVDLSASPYLALFQNTDMHHYVSYYPDPDGVEVDDITTDAELVNDDGTNSTGTTTIEDLTKIRAQTGADGIFTVTFGTSTLVGEASATNTALYDDLTEIGDDANEAIADAVAAAKTALRQSDKTTTTINTALEAIRTAVKDLSGVDGDTDTIIDTVKITETEKDFVDDGSGTEEDPATAERDFESPDGFLAKIIKAITDDIAPEQTKFVLEIHTFGVKANGETVNNAIYRPLLEETGDGSAVFEGTIEYKMLNQRTLHDTATHKSITTIGNELVIILDKDYTGTDAPETTYNEDNASEDAPTNTGEVSVDAAIYSVADDVTITLTDLDLNTDSGAREIFDIVNSTGYTEMPPLVSIKIGSLDCKVDIRDISLRETADDSGVFEGSFEIPDACGVDNAGDPILTTGESITVTYTDFRDETGGDSEWSDSATIGADTGSVSLDRTVYPVPPTDNAVKIHVSVDDADENTSSSSRETVSGVELKVAGVVIGLSDLEETEPDSGIFEATATVNSTANRADDKDNLIEQGDIITVTYTDASDASGNLNTASDSATFDLRNAVLQSDKSVYVIGPGRAPDSDRAGSQP